VPGAELHRRELLALRTLRRLRVLRLKHFDDNSAYQLFNTLSFGAADLE
jgi:hypothetical protein